MAQLFDINTAFNRNLVNNSVATVSNKHAVAQIIYNLLDTQTLEIPFKEWEGSGLSALLGEACSNITASVIAEQIRGLIEKYIPYIELENITYLLDPDNQQYVFILYYSFVNQTEVIEQKLVLSTTI